MNLEYVLAAALFIGVVAGTVLVFRNPLNWFEIGSTVFKAVLPELLKRMPPEEEKKWRKKKLEGDIRDR